MIDINVLSEKYDAFCRTGEGPIFAQACANDNSTDDLIEGLLMNRADTTDMEAWEITATEWRHQIAVALKWKIDWLEDEIAELKGGK